MTDMVDPPPETAPAAELVTTNSEIQAAHDVVTEQTAAEPAVETAGGVPAEVTEEATSTQAAVPTEAVSAAPAATTAVRGRGRGRGRGATGNKRGTSKSAAATATVGGRGRGKRKSEAAALAQDAGLEADSSTASIGVEPRKRRKAAQKSKRIIETDDEDGEDAVEDRLTADAQEQSTAMQVDQPAEATTTEAAPEPQEAVSDASLPAKAKNFKLKLGFRRGSQQVEDSGESPIEPMASAAPPVKGDSATKAGETTSMVTESSTSQALAPVDDTTMKEASVGLPNLFDDDDAPASQGQAKDEEKDALPSEKTTETSASDSLAEVKKESASSAASSKSKPAVRASSASQDKKPSPSGSTPLNKPGLAKKLAPGVKSGSAISKSSAATAGSGTPAGSSPAGLIKKRVPKPGVGVTSTPKASTGTSAKPPPVETSFLDALFADTIPQTEHERQLQREREERSRKEQAVKAKKAKEDAEAKKKAAAASAASTAGLVPAGGKPPPLSLASMKTIPAQRQPGTSVLSRLGGSEKLRQQEIEKLRAESRRQQEKLAEVCRVRLLYTWWV